MEMNPLKMKPYEFAMIFRKFERGCANGFSQGLFMDIFGTERNCQMSTAWYSI